MFLFGAIFIAPYGLNIQMQNGGCAMHRPPSLCVVLVVLAENVTKHESGAITVNGNRTDFIINTCVLESKVGFV